MLFDTQNRYAIASRKPYSYILQFTICLGQLYGCLVYFITALLEGDNFSASPYYYWAYYIGANSSWVVIPALIAIRSWKKISAAFQVEKKTKTRWGRIHCKGPGEHKIPNFQWFTSKICGFNTFCGTGFHRINCCITVVGIYLFRGFMTPRKLCYSNLAQHCIRFEACDILNIMAFGDQLSDGGCFGNES